MVKASEKSARVQAVSPTLSSHSFRRYTGAPLLDVAGPILDVLDGCRRPLSHTAPWELPPGRSDQHRPGRHVRVDPQPQPKYSPPRKSMLRATTSIGAASSLAHSLMVPPSEDPVCHLV